MNRPVKAALCAVALSACFVVAAIAADSAPETVAQATGDTTKITWAWGAVVQQWASALRYLLVGLITYGLRLLPAHVYAVIVSVRADQLLQKAIDYGVNAVEGATKGKTLTVDVGNQVLAQAVHMSSTMCQHGCNRGLVVLTRS